MNEAEVRKLMDEKVLDRREKTKVSSSCLATSPRDEVVKLSKFEQEQIRSVSTFDPKGVCAQDAEDFLSNTQEGEEFLRGVYEADPSATDEEILARAKGLIQTGIDFPQPLKKMETLYKITPSGSGISSYSPYFTTKPEIEMARSSGRNLADYFGLPVASDAKSYDLYKIEATGKAKAYTSTTAPTSELNGKFVMQGGGKQVIVTNRSEFSDPVKIGTISNR